MSDFSLRIIAADKTFFDGRCHTIIVPAIDGGQQIMSHHESMVIATKAGEIRFKETEKSKWQTAVVGVGFVHIANNRVIMLVDTAERPEDIDAERAKRAMEQAKEELRQKQSIEEYRITRAALARAMVRLRNAGKIELE